MPGGLRIHLYCLCWNDARMLPFFFRHYDEYVDAYFVYDNGSTDGSLKLLADHPRVEVEHFDVKGDSFVDEERRMGDEIWKRSRGKADWVIVTDIDEHAYRPDLLGYLARCKSAGITAIRTIGYEMVSDRFPEGDGKLTDLVTSGVRSVGHNRLCIFNPNAVTATHFGPGRHKAWPEGHVVWPLSSEVVLLHYKQLGTAYVAARSAELAKGIKSGDIENGWGTHYTWSPDEIVAAWAKMRGVARPVPGLGELRYVAPSDFRGDEKIVDDSGLLDADWYMERYPDIGADRSDPSDALVHFCKDGWREGRFPNLYFDTQWYLDTSPDVAAKDINPLVDYIVRGEREGARPSIHFDPAWYREKYQLARDESPLRHFLQRRHQGTFSPLPDFDLEDYCRNHPEIRAENRDPYEDYLERAQALAEASPAEAPPFSQVMEALGFEPYGDIFPAQVPWGQFLKVLRLFARSVPFDETWYRMTYPDVDQAIREGSFRTARDHYVEHGYFENRSPGPSPAPPEPPVEEQPAAGDGEIADTATAGQIAADEAPARP